MAAAGKKAKEQEKDRVAEEAAAAQVASTMSVAEFTEQGIMEARKALEILDNRIKHADGQIAALNQERNNLERQKLHVNGRLTALTEISNLGKQGDWVLSALSLVDAVLVEVKVKSSQDPYMFDEDRGLVLPTEDESNLGFNFGKVLRVPSFIVDEKYSEVAKSIKVGDTVFFSASRSYNYLPQKDDSIKLLMIPVSSVDAIVLKDDSNEESSA